MSSDHDHITTTPFDFDALIQAKLDALKSKGSYRHFITIDKQADLFPTFTFKDQEGIIKKATNWCTNDYLALSTWSENRKIAQQVTLSSGTGSGGTRNISGNTMHHRLLESTLAAWHMKGSAILFNSAYQANQTTLSTLGRHIPGLIFISDEENHASMIEGMRATSNIKLIFKHNDVDHLEALIKNVDKATPKIIVFESVYSISGTIAPIRKILKLAKKYNCLTYIDEVHAVGLYGSNGSGLLSQLGLSSEADFINGTLSKAIGTFGGYLAASHQWIDFIRSFGPGFIFTTSLPPAICAAADHSIKEISSNKSLREHFFNNVKRLRKALQVALITYTGEDTHITNIFIGDAHRCKEITNQLLEDYGLYLQPINHPTVPEGKACLRITVTPRHSTEDIDYLAQSLSAVLKPKITVVGRNSRLSKAQIFIVCEKIKKHFPNIHIEVHAKETKGDRLAHVPLHTQEGIDFFTEEVFDELGQGKADLAIHSLKDMSNTHFFGENSFAVIDRDEVRDIALFSHDIITKIKAGQTIRIGTCSFRRELMAFDVLQKVLPNFGKAIKIEAIPIRGNIDTRLKKLNTGEYDGIILAIAGLNRMLKSAADCSYFQELLGDKKWMVLPLIDCVPAPCQGAIVAEALPSNTLAQTILHKIKDYDLQEVCVEEKRIASLYGSGCIQKFGVSTIKISNQSMVLAKGFDELGNSFEDWHGMNLQDIDFHPDGIISSDALGFTPHKTPIKNHFKVKSNNSYFVSHISAIEFMTATDFENIRVWAAGIATWTKIAKKGIWVEGCADSLGFESIGSLLSTKFVDLNPQGVMILTNQTSAENWRRFGYQAIQTYDLTYHSSLLDKYKLTTAKMIFWNCFAHFEQVQGILPEGIIHACLPGKTTDLLKNLGLQPIVFPTINAFNQWKKKYTQAFIAA